MVRCQSSIPHVRHIHCEQRHVPVDIACVQLVPARHCLVNAFWSEIVTLWLRSSSGWVTGAPRLMHAHIHYIIYRLISHCIFLTYFIDSSMHIVSKFILTKTFYATCRFRLFASNLYILQNESLRTPYFRPWSVDHSLVRIKVSVMGNISYQSISVRFMNALWIAIRWFTVRCLPRVHLGAHGNALSEKADCNYEIGLYMK